MKREFKIIMEFEDEDMDTDGSPHTKTIVYLDNEPVGLLQSLKLLVDANSFFPELELTFPNFHSNKINPEYFNNSTLLEETDRYIKRLQKVPGIKISFKEIF